MPLMHLSMSKTGKLAGGVLFPGSVDVGAGLRGEQDVGDLVPVSLLSSGTLVLGILLHTPSLAQPAPVSSESPCKEAGAL